MRERALIRSGVRRAGTWPLSVGETGELENWDMENWRTKRCRGRGHHTEVRALSWRCGAGQDTVVRNGVIKTRRGRVGGNPGWLSKESGPARLLGTQAGTGEGDWQAGRQGTLVRHSYNWSCGEVEAKGSWGGGIGRSQAKRPLRYSRRRHRIHQTSN